MKTARYFLCIALMLLLAGVYSSAYSEMGVDAVLVIDSSGSMKQSDPKNMRRDAARLFISLLRKEDRAGVVEFAEGSRTLAELAAAGNGRGRDALLKAAYSVGSTGAYTNIHEGLRRGFAALGEKSANERIIILMSDGKIDLGDKRKEETLTAQIMNELLPELGRDHVRVYTIAFTEHSDRILLEQVAEKTGGFFCLAKTGADLHLVFSALFEKIKSPDTLPLQGNGFFVDKDVRELTLLATKKSPNTSVTIVDPSSKKLTLNKHGPDLNWFGSAAFEMITVKQPAAGRWSVRLTSTDGNRIFIVTDLRLRSSFDKNFVDQGAILKIDAWLERDKEVVKAKDVLDHVSLSGRVTTPDGKTIDLVLHPSRDSGGDTAVSGISAAQFRPEQPGDYSLKLSATAETFKREKDFAFRVVPVAQRRLAPHSAQTSPQKAEPREAATSWTSVFIRLFLINAVVLALIGSGNLLGRFFKKTRDRKK